MTAMWQKAEEELTSIYQVYLDALVLDAEPVVPHRGGVNKYLRSIEERRHKTLNYQQRIAVGDPAFYEVLELSQRVSWTNLIKPWILRFNNHDYKSKGFCSGISFYHHAEFAPDSVNLYDFIDEYCLWVASGVWNHRQNYTNFRNAYKHEVCAAYFNYPAEQRGETYTTIFTGSLDKVSKIADFMDTLGTPSFRFVASPVITIPPDHSCEEFDKQVSALSNLLEWCSNGEYWIGGGAVVKHKTGRCDCPECVDFHKW